MSGCCLLLPLLTRDFRYSFLYGKSLVLVRGYLLLEKGCSPWLMNPFCAELGFDFRVSLLFDASQSRVIGLVIRDFHLLDAFARLMTPSAHALLVFRPCFGPNLSVKKKHPLRVQGLVCSSTG